MPYALQVFEDPDHDGRYHWLVLQEFPYNSCRFVPHSASECSVASYGAAASAGAKALARVEGMDGDGGPAGGVASLGDAPAVQRVAWPYRPNPAAWPLGSNFTPGSRA